MQAKGRTPCDRGGAAMAICWRWDRRTPPGERRFAGARLRARLGPRGGVRPAARMSVPNAPAPV